MASREEEKEARRQERSGIMQAQRADERQKQQAAIDIKRITTLNGMAGEIGEWAKGKGFREDWDQAQAHEHFADMLMGTDVGETIVLNRVVGDDLSGVDLAMWQVLNENAESIRSQVIGTKLMLIVSEASEALETLRDVGGNGVIEGEGNFVEELADIIIRTLDLANIVGGDIGAALVQKLQVNAGRAYKHGRSL